MEKSDPLKARVFFPFNAQIATTHRDSKGKLKLENKEDKRAH